MSDLSNITVNGVPLKEVVDEQLETEIEKHRQIEVIERSWSRPVSGTRYKRSVSGSRSGRCRVIMLAGVMQ